MNTIKKFISSENRPLIIDSGCGTGLSTIKLAKKFPDHVVIGIDKSKDRLSRALASKGENFLLVRGDLIDLWRLFKLEGIAIARHYIFFPNPWPKAKHLTRRIYAHPVFLDMLSMSPYLELRTNWKIYADECVEALKILGQKPKVMMKTDRDHMTLFEKKYVEASCPIYIITNKLATDTCFRSAFGISDSQTCASPSS